MVAELILLLTKHHISCWWDGIEIARNKIITTPDQGFTWYVGGEPWFGAIVHLHIPLCDVTVPRHGAIAAQIASIAIACHLLDYDYE